jgi:hypothetical protein
MMLFCDGTAKIVVKKYKYKILKKKKKKRKMFKFISYSLFEKGFSEDH